MTISGKELTWIVACYFLGCFTAGYYWVRWRTGRDLRREGSGSVGARNAGRLTGRSAFLVTLGLDFAKGALAVGGGWLLGLSPELLMAALIAVVLGHNWPFQLHFQGGKGVAVSLGALMVYDPFIPVILVVLFLPLYLFTRSVTLSGMLAYALAPLMVFLCNLGPVATFGMSATSMLVVFAHRSNIREILSRLTSERSEKNLRSHPREGGAP